MIPTLTTERLTMRAPRLSDFDTYAEFRASDRASFVGGPNTRREAWQQICAIAGQWALRGYGRWLVADRETDAPLGVVGIHHPEEWPEAEIGWSMFAAGEGRGLAQEAALASRRYAYETLGRTTIISLIDPANTRSVALGRRMGCRPDGTFEHEVFGTMHVWRHPGPGEATTTETA
ncbi:GNAT family N-acetyltransferase [Rhodobacterales bacterium HKCCE2091]|nr:GNAT family N-acetyltransferase [Rhodobacterales bacterium HKCCE2091]